MIEANCKIDLSGTREQKENSRSGVYCRCTTDFVRGLALGALGFTPDYTPSRIVKSGPCTIVFWQDGTKTVVRCPADTIPNDYEAFTAALAIRMFKTNSQVKKMIQRLTVIQPPKVKKKKVDPVDGETE